MPLRKVGARHKGRPRPYARFWVCAAAMRDPSFLAQRSTSILPSSRRGLVWMTEALLCSGGLPTNVGSRCRLLSR